MTKSRSPFFMFIVKEEKIKYATNKVLHDGTSRVESKPATVLTCSPSSNRTCGFPASGFPIAFSSLLSGKPA
ncbi:MAG: hypothetical protein J7K75_07875, partial [Desulfuromonas sp.]|nr:hypothetical protein [Desulfuromonas sp.]